MILLKFEWSNILSMGNVLTEVPYWNKAVCNPIFLRPMGYFQTDFLLCSREHL